MLNRILVLLVLLGIPGWICAVESRSAERFKFMHLSINDGLSNNQVKAALKDRDGFMWFATGQGLNRFDGTNFKIYSHDAFDPGSIPFSSVDYFFEDWEHQFWLKQVNDFVLFDPSKNLFSALPATYKDTRIPLAGLYSLANDKAGKIWFVSSSRGLYSYDPRTAKADSVRFDATAFGSRSNDYFNAIAFDSNNKLWAVTHRCHVLKIDPETQKTEARYAFDSEISSDYSNFSIYIDSDDEVWVYAAGQPYGIFRIIPATGKTIHYTEGAGLGSPLVSSVTEERKGTVWISTDHGGIDVLDKATGSFTSLTNNRDDEYSLAQNSVNFLYRDVDGIIWAGTYKKGLSYYHPSLVQFRHYKYVPSKSNSLPYDDVNCFAEDASGNLWIGTNGGGLIFFNRKENTFKRYLHHPSDPNSLCADVIVALHYDRNGQLWIGSYFGGLDRFDGQTFHHHKHDNNDPGSISDDRVWEIFEDSRQNLWIGTLAGGLNLYDREKDLFYHYRSGDVNSVGSDFVTSITEDSEKNLWIGTSNGIDRLNLDTRRFYHFDAQAGVPGALNDRSILDLHDDSRGLLWIATVGGLSVYDQHTGKFRVFTTKEGLADNFIKTLQEDQNGSLWLSTTHGITKVEVLDGGNNRALDDLRIVVSNYDLVDGLQGREFNEKSAFRTRAGELIFGGGNGFNLFIPEQISPADTHNKIILTGFKIFNQEVKVGEQVSNRVLLEHTLDQQPRIVLRYSENVFSIGFAALNFFHPEKNRFEYKLEGFNEEWLSADPKNNEATFTNLNAGDYEFRVRVSADGKQWNELSAPLKITVLPPFWKSRWALALYLLLAGAALFFGRRMFIERQRLKFEAEQEHREAQRIQQLDSLKTKFFTNISHEFRTPLTLILAPLEKLILKTEDPKSRNQLIFVHRQSRRLLTMVNQLLDFRKMEFQKIDAKRSWGELNSFIRDLGNSFEDMAAHKRITYGVDVPEAAFYTWFDQDKVYKMISNLLSNAFKFTPENGAITLHAAVGDDTFDLHEQPHVWLEVAVTDTGIGIAADKQTRIFDRFYQDDVPGSMVNQGSGIGLSMVAEYVNILEGSVGVSSTPGSGSTFTLKIPVQLLAKAEIDAINESREPHDELKFFAESQQADPKDDSFDPNKKTLLIVDDNDDFRFYLKDNLRERYNVVEGRNGQEGWNACLKHLPDLVVSDVMMPVLTGTDLCRKVKADGRVSHIPVILLTAKAEADDKIEGLESGADDYIAKPFDFRILESRIENLISTREQLRQTYQAMIGINPEKIEVTSLDEKFIKRALEVVEENISNADFSVEDLSREVGMSRVSLYKKLLSLTKKSPVEFIRIIRLKRAADLLENSQLSVSEIAYRVGFNSPRYFARYFKEYYNELPSEFIVRKRRIKSDFEDRV